MLSEGGVRSSTFRIGEVAGGQKLRLLVFAKYKMLLRILILQWNRGAPDPRQCFEGHIATGNHRCARDGASLLVLVVDETIISRFEVQRFPSCSGSAIAPSLYSMRNPYLLCDAFRSSTRVSLPYIP
jgi:hypothetical protein